MMAILDSLNAHNLSIFQSILMILLSNSWLIELFLIKHTYHEGCCPLFMIHIFILRRVKRLNYFVLFLLFSALIHKDIWYRL